MKNKEYNKFRHSGGGKGGYKCPCCGPDYSMRKAYNRSTRRKLKHTTDKVIRDALDEYYD